MAYEVDKNNVEKYVILFNLKYNDTFKPDNATEHKIKKLIDIHVVYQFHIFLKNIDTLKPGSRVLRFFN